MTEIDRKIINPIMLSNGRHYSPEFVMVSIGLFYRKHGRLPRSGIELCSPSPRVSLVGELEAKDDAELFAVFAPAVNFATGRIQGTYTSPEWSPGGVYLELADEQVVREDFADSPPAPGKELPAVMTIRMFGETEGSVLYENTSVIDEGQLSDAVAADDAGGGGHGSPGLDQTDPGTGGDQSHTH